MIANTRCDQGIIDESKLKTKNKKILKFVYLSFDKEWNNWPR